MNILLWSTAGLLLGFGLDMLFGDVEGFPHIIRWMGALIAALDRRLPHSEAGGTVLVLTVTCVCTGIPLGCLFLCYRHLPVLGFLIESFLCWQLLAARSLKTESMKVYQSLLAGDVESARKSVAMIVGRDTEGLDGEGIMRATVETIAENASDGVAAPLLYIMAGGAAFGCLYKAVNTMDSMVGYKNDRYLHFGRMAAKTDDVLNFIPSRLCALLMVLSAFLLRYDGRQAYRIWRRDRHCHASPNSGQTEAACAGALGIRLAGPAFYDGTLYNKPFIGDDRRRIEPGDIQNANKLMYASSYLALFFAVIVRFIIYAAI